jgi:hypothetical protein
MLPPTGAKSGLAPFFARTVPARESSWNDTNGIEAQIFSGFRCAAPE